MDVVSAAGEEHHVAGTETRYNHVLPRGIGTGRIAVTYETAFVWQPSVLVRREISRAAVNVGVRVAVPG